jgi:hypothetical protein
VSASPHAAFVNENNHLDPILAFQKAIAVPRNHVASTFKASWQSGHDSLFNSQFNSNMFSTVGSLNSGAIGQSAPISSRLRAGGPRNLRSQQRRKGPIKKTSHFMYTLIFVLGLLAAAYVAVRLWDASELYDDEMKIWRLVYRVFVIGVELMYAVAMLAYLRLGVKFAAATQPRQRCASAWPRPIVSERASERLHSVPLQRFLSQRPWLLVVCA